jgi:hypothetical protein
VLSRIMPGPHGRPRPEVAFAHWLLIAILGVGMMALGESHTLGFAFAFIGSVAAACAWPDAQQARRAELRRRRDVQPHR